MKKVHVTEAQVEAARMLVQAAREKGEVPDRATLRIALAGGRPLPPVKKKRRLFFFRRK